MESVPRKSACTQFHSSKCTSRGLQTQKECDKFQARENQERVPWKKTYVRDDLFFHWNRLFLLVLPGAWEAVLAPSGESTLGQSWDEEKVERTWVVNVVRWLNNQPRKCPDSEFVVQLESDYYCLCWLEQWVFFFLSDRGWVLEWEGHDDSIGVNNGLSPFWLGEVWGEVFSVAKSAVCTWQNP